MKWKWIRLTLLLLVMIGCAGDLFLRRNLKPHDCNSLKTALQPAETILAGYDNERYKGTLTTKKSWEYASKIEAEISELKKVKLWGDRKVKLYYSAILEEFLTLPSKARVDSGKETEDIGGLSFIYMNSVNRYCDSID